MAAQALFQAKAFTYIKIYRQMYMLDPKFINITTGHML